MTRSKRDENWTCPRCTCSHFRQQTVPSFAAATGKAR